MSEIKDYVLIFFNDKPFITVGEIQIDFPNLRKDIITDNSLEDKDNINTICWDKSRQFNSLSDGTIAYNNGACISFDETRYDSYVQSFVDLWQIEKDKMDEEQQEQEDQHQQAQEEYNKFENRQARALTQLNDDFETAKQRAYIKSSLGFTIDANQTANENITGLLVTIGETETIQFCDYYNKFRELNKTQLQILQTELITNAQSLYQQKWQYRHAIEDCVDNEGLDAVLATIEFTYMDFTPTGDSETGEQP